MDLRLAFLHVVDNISCIPCIISYIMHGLALTEWVGLGRAAKIAGLRDDDIASCTVP